MASSQVKKVFRVHLSISVVLLLITLSTLSLFASFYLGMITGKSMQRPPEKLMVEEELIDEKPMSEDDLKFFGLGDRKKGQDLLDLEEINELKNKTNELTKISKNKKIISTKINKVSTPKVSIPKNPDPEQVNLKNKKQVLPKMIEQKNTDTKVGSRLKIEKEPIYTIQVLASRNQKNAKNLLEKLKKDGFKNAFIFKHSAGSKTLYRVRVGKVSQTETKILSKKLKKLKYIDSVQVSRF